MTFWSADTQHLTIFVATATRSFCGANFEFPLLRSGSFNRQLWQVSSPYQTSCWAPSVTSALEFLGKEIDKILFYLLKDFNFSVWTRELGLNSVNHLATLSKEPHEPRKHIRPIDVHWISLGYHTFKRWPLDIYRISRASWDFKGKVNRLNLNSTVPTKYRNGKFVVGIGEIVVVSLNFNWISFGLRGYRIIGWGIGKWFWELERRFHFPFSR